jgi:TonB-dependent SusC/RagA subfamily outer membrane receptor
MKHSLIAFILACSVQPAAFSQTRPEGFQTVLTRLEWARKNRPVENIHLHFDKPYYSPGDTAYFKAYVTLNEQHQPTPLSEVLHVDLIDPFNRIVQGIKLQLKRGCASADFGLPDSLRAGRYQVRAYTRWMLNAGESYYSSFSVGIPKRPVRGRTVDTASNSVADVQFFPEGGELLTGIETKVAFKSIGKNGLGMKAKGIVTDNTGKEITRFQTAHLGMGFFYLRPEPGKSYRASMTFADGSTARFDLPLPNARAMMLAADGDSVIHIFATDAYLQTHPGEPISLLICSGGGSSSVQAVLSGGDIGIALDKRRMHPGIARITLFSSRGEPVSERLLFINGPDSLSLSVKSDKPTYQRRQKVELSIDARGKAGGAGQANFSVSVTNEDLLRVDENNQKTILSDLLLSSALKGYIEQPGYYFSQPGESADANLDLLMLTQGYRHFIWKQILQDSLPPPAYKAEKFLQIQGYIRTSAGKLVSGENVTLTDTTGRGPDLTTKTDAVGHFAFTNLIFDDTMHFWIHPARSILNVFLSGASGPPLESVVTVEPAPEIGAALSTYLKVAVKEHQIEGNSRAQVLKPVVVKAKAPYQTQSLAGEGHADQVLHASDIQGGGTLSTALNGRLFGVLVTGRGAILTTDLALASVGASQHMLIVVDGVQESDDSGQFYFDAVPLSDVETVEVLKGASASIYGINAGGGVLVITTKSGDDLEAGKLPDRSGLYGAFMGFYKGREFYSPRYEVTDAFKEQDLRTTVCWKPEIITDRDGKATFSFYNSDLTGNYRVEVEGIDGNGNLARQVYRYQVK